MPLKTDVTFLLTITSSCPLSSSSAEGEGYTKVHLRLIDMYKFLADVEGTEI